MYTIFTFFPTKSHLQTEKRKKGSKIESKCFNGPDSIGNQVLDKKMGSNFKYEYSRLGVRVSLKDGILLVKS